MEQRMVCLGQYRNRRIYTHRGYRFRPISCHRQDTHLKFLIRVAESLLHTLSFFICVFRYTLIRNLKLLKRHQFIIQPLAVGTGGRKSLFQFIIIDHPAL